MIDDKKARDILQLKIAQIKEYSRTAQQEVENIMAKKYNAKYSTTVDIFNGILPLETMSYDMMFKLMKSIHQMIIENERYEKLDASSLNTERYFTSVEIKQFNKPLERDDTDIDMIFNNWLQVNPDQYITVVPIEQIIEWRNLNKIKYNPKTQRELTEKVTKGGTLIKVVTVFKESLKAIYKLMANNDFISDVITLNVNPDIHEEPAIVRGSLVIPKESHADLVDGFHRYLEMCEVKDNNPEWNYNAIIMITMFNEEKANQFMLQMDKKNHLSDKQIRKIDKLDENNYTITRLNSSTNFHLKGTIDDNMFVFLSRLLEKNFKLDNRQDAVMLSKNIENNINYIVEEKELFDKTLTKFEWFVYIYIIKKVNGSSERFKDVISKLDLNDIFNNIKFKNEPLKTHYKMIDRIISSIEVKK